MVVRLNGKKPSSLPLLLDGGILLCYSHNFLQGCTQVHRGNPVSLLMTTEVQNVLCSTGGIRMITETDILKSVHLYRTPLKYKDY